MPDGGQWQHAVEVNAVKEEYDAAMAAAEASLGAYKSSGDGAGEAAAQHSIAKIKHAKGDNSGAKVAAQEALDKARAAGDRNGEAAALHTLARLHFDVQKFDETERNESLDQTEKLAGEALEIFKATGNKKGEASVTVTISKSYFLRGQFDEAIEKADKATSLFAEADDRNGQAAALITKSIVNLFWGAGKWDAAAKAAKEAVALCKKVTKPSAQHREADAWLMICAACLPMSKTDEALTAAKSALSLMETLGGNHKLAIAMRALAFAHVMAGNIEEALQKFDEALGLVGALDDKSLKATLLVTGGIAHRVKFTAAKNQGRQPAYESQQRALAHVGEAVGIFQELGDESSAALARIELAQAHIASGSAAEGMGLAQTSRDYFESLEDKAGEGIAMLTLADGLHQSGEVETAYGAAKQAQEKFNAVGGAGEGSKAASELLDLLEAEMRQKREKGQWGAIDAGTFTGDFQGFGGISRAIYTKLFAQTLHLPDRPYEVMLDAPMFQSMDSIMASLARQNLQPPKEKATRVRSEGGSRKSAEAPSRPDGQTLRQVPLKEVARAAPPVVTPIVHGTDMLGGRTWDCPESVHSRMVEMATRGDIPITKPEQRSKLINKRPTFYGSAEWRDAVKLGYIHPDINPPRGLKWRKVTMGWKLVGGDDAR